MASNGTPDESIEQIFGKPLGTVTAWDIFRLLREKSKRVPEPERGLSDEDVDKIAGAVVKALREQE